MQNLPLCNGCNGNANILSINNCPNVIGTGNETIAERKACTACHVIFHNARQIEQEHDLPRFSPIAVHNGRGNGCRIKKLDFKLTMYKTLPACTQKRNGTQQHPYTLHCQRKRKKPKQPAPHKDKGKLHLKTVILACHFNGIAKVFKTGLVFAGQSERIKGRDKSQNFLTPGRVKAHQQ